MFGKDQSSSGSEQSKTTYVTGGLLSRFGTISRDLNTTEVASAPFDAKVSPLLEEETEEMEKRSTRHPLDEVELIPAVYTFLGYGRFWLAFALNMFATLFFASGLYLPTFATSALGYSDSAATLLLTAGATGSLFGNLIGGTGLDVTACQSVVRPIRILFQALALFAYGITVCLGFGLTDGPIGPNSTASMIASLLPMLLPLYSVARDTLEYLSQPLHHTIRRAKALGDLDRPARCRLVYRAILHRSYLEGSRPTTADGHLTINFFAAPTLCLRASDSRCEARVDAGGEEGES